MDKIIVAKFGGSSLADSEQFKKVKRIVDLDANRRYIVPSAPGKRDRDDHKVTNLLYMCHQLASHGLGFEEVYSIIEKRFQEICRDLGAKMDIALHLEEIKGEIQKGASQDFVASRGEYLNALVLADFLGYEFVDAKDIFCFDEKNILDAEKTNQRVAEVLANVERAVIPGFYGANNKGEIVTFSRGGSDISGAIIARGMGAVLYENWTDVPGFLVADPHIVKDPQPIASITYKELRELSYMGAPVLHEESVFPVKIAGIPIQVKNTNDIEAPGTLIVSDTTENIQAGTITGIAGKKDFTVITIEKTRMNLEKDFYRKLVTVLETNDITIEHMPSSIDSVSLVIRSEQLSSKLDKVIEEIRIYCQPNSIVSYPNMALIAVVGRGMIRTKGVSAKIFTALAQKGVNIRMITQGASEMNIIVGVENSDFDQAIRSIYEAFIE